jgi:DNA-binding transcriptional regulator YiaG
MNKDQLRQLQEEHNLTNEEFAESLGVSLSLVEKWRNGRRHIQTYHAMAIVEKYVIRLKKRRK